MGNFRLYVVYAKTVAERSELPYEEAIEHYRELLRLNPGDGQGNRYTLLDLLMQIER